MSQRLRLQRRREDNLPDAQQADRDRVVSLSSDSLIPAVDGLSTQQNAVLRMQQQRGNAFVQRYIASLTIPSVQRAVTIDDMDISDPTTAEPSTFSKHQDENKDDDGAPPADEIWTDEKDKKKNYYDQNGNLYGRDDPDMGYMVYDKKDGWRIAPNYGGKLPDGRTVATPDETESDNPLLDEKDFPRPVPQAGEVVSVPTGNGNDTYPDPALENDPDDPYAETGQQQVISHLEDKNPGLKQRMDQYPTMNPDDSTDETAAKYMKSRQVWENDDESN